MEKKFITLDGRLGESIDARLSEVSDVCKYDSEYETWCYASMKNGQVHGISEESWHKLRIALNITDG